MRVIQRLQLPDSELCEMESMYFNHKDEDDEIEYDYEGKCYTFKKNSELLGNTYFNSFSECKWHKYTVIEKVFLR